jgi:putative ATPase
MEMKTRLVPLADRMRPKTAEEFFGQQKSFGEGTFLRNSLKTGNIPSVIFWGPPGTGKTTLAFLLAQMLQAHFIALSGVVSGKKDLQKILVKAEENKGAQIKTILFVDEIHRWNKAQQDALLPHVENGLITLIGATTENPSFEIISALLSRCRVVVFESLSDEDIERVLFRAIHDKRNGLGERKLCIEKGAVKFLAVCAHGDARTALNALEICAESGSLSVQFLEQFFQKAYILYDKKGEEHYNLISALHKSMRGGDAQAAVYWLLRMLEGGEDPLYIARRLIRFASEDVGLANNTALLLANTVFDACHKLGMPECGVHLAHCVVYLSRSEKDISAYTFYNQAEKDVKQFGSLPVPLHLRNASTPMMKNLGYGQEYMYTPLEESCDQTYLPEILMKKYAKGNMTKNRTKNTPA